MRFLRVAFIATLLSSCLFGQATAFKKQTSFGKQTAFPGVTSGGATITLTQSNSFNTGSSVTGVCTLSSSVASGDLIIVTGQNFTNGGLTFATADGSGQGTTYTDTTGISPHGVPGGQWTQYLQWGILATGTASLTLTTTATGGSANVFNGACFDFHSTTGWPGSPINGTPTATNGTTVSTLTATGVTTTVASALVFASLATDNVYSSGATVNAPFTIQLAGGTGGYGSVLRGFGGTDMNVAAGTYGAVFSWTGSTSASLLEAAFKPN
jgi:hypothetical protein